MLEYCYCLRKRIEPRKFGYSADPHKGPGITRPLNSYPLSFGAPIDTRQPLFAAIPGNSKTQPGLPSSIPPLAAFRTGPIKATGGPKKEKARVMYFLFLY